jgi:hypothetical protein
MCDKFLREWVNAFYRRCPDAHTTVPKAPRPSGKVITPSWVQESPAPRLHDPHRALQHPHNPQFIPHSRNLAYGEPTIQAPVQQFTIHRKPRKVVLEPPPKKQDDIYPIHATWLVCPIRPHPSTS